jgi:hypothetical protein
MKAFFAKRSSAVGIGLAALFFLSGCPVYPDNTYSQGPRCTYATDCPVGYHCTSGFCMLAPPLGGASAGPDASGGQDAAVDANVTDVVGSDGVTDVATTDVATEGGADVAGGVGQGD